MDGGGWRGRRGRGEARGGKRLDDSIEWEKECPNPAGKPCQPPSVQHQPSGSRWLTNFWSIPWGFFPQDQLPGRSAVGQALSCDPLVIIGPGRVPGGIGHLAKPCRRGLSHCYRLPVYRLLIYRLPIYRLPIYRLPIHRLPVYRLPVYRLPVYRLPIYTVWFVQEHSLRQGSV
jgi:hypothetical protein